MVPKFYHQSDLLYILLLKFYHKSTFFLNIKLYILLKTLLKNDIFNKQKGTLRFR